MAGRICDWSVVYMASAFLFASSPSIRTSAAAELRGSIASASGGYQTTGNKVVVDSEYRDSLKVLPVGNIELGLGLSPPSSSSSSSAAENKFRTPFASSFYGLQNPSDTDEEVPENVEPEVAERNDFDKRVPSSYKLKYGGLGKRKLGSSSLRYGGLGKRLSPNDVDGAVMMEAGDRDGDLERDSSKDSLDAAYFLSRRPLPSNRMLDNIDDLLRQNKKWSADAASQSKMPAFAMRQYRSRTGMGMRYSGLGKRSLALSDALNI